MDGGVKAMSVWGEVYAPLPYEEVSKGETAG